MARPSARGEVDRERAALRRARGVEAVAARQHVAAPGGPDAVLRFERRGAEAAESVTGGVCLAFEYEVVAEGGTQETTGQRGDCANGVAVSVEPGLGEVLFELRGADVRPGSYRFDASGGPQAGTLVVDLAAR